MLKVTFKGHCWNILVMQILFSNIFRILEDEFIYTGQMIDRDVLVCIDNDYWFHFLLYEISSIEIVIYSHLINIKFLLISHLLTPMNIYIFITDISQNKQNGQMVLLSSYLDSMICYKIQVKC